MSDNRPIGVFDSGMGGLSVLKALTQYLPHEHFLYLGDTARLPYGTKSLNTIIFYADKMAKALIAHDIKMLIIACNSATAAALDYLRASYPSLPIIGVIEPSAKTALEASKNQHIAVLATEATKHSGIYQKTLHELAPEAEVTLTPCSLFVALAEEGCVDDEIAIAAIKKYLTPIVESAAHPDCILLGCTHFPVLQPAISDFLPSHIHVINSADSVASHAKTVLKDKNLLSLDPSHHIHFMVTDAPERFARVGQRFLGREINSEEVELV